MDDRMDRMAGRVIALIVLLLVAGAALHGYLPPAGHREPRAESESPVALILLVGLGAAGLVVVAGAIINRMRAHPARAGTISALSLGVGGDRRRPNWRVLLLGAVLVTAWLLVILLAMGWAGPQRVLSWVGLLGAAGDHPTPGAGAPSPGGSLPQQGSAQHRGGGAYGPLMSAAFLLLVLILAGTAVSRSRRRQQVPAAVVDEPAAKPAPTSDESLVRAAELGLAEIADPSREPRAAIIACYAVMERHLGYHPDVAPREFDTPTEVLARAVEHHALPAENAAGLVALFTEARFSPHRMTEHHRAEAVRILRLVLDELRSAA